MTPTPYKQKLALIKKYQSGFKIARLAQEAGVSRKTFYIWLENYRKSKPNLAHLNLSDRRFKKVVKINTLHPKDRLLVVNKVLNKEASVAQLCREFKISRKTFYKWLKKANFKCLTGIVLWNIIISKW